ncbi:ApbE family lipoprotein [Catenovulum agarivorans DS-2]|uniref:FAD:protein FMN transferase n=1 Tax=Catenovulum agarivorans DS-2 TaxID=1328313 RepID=W7Q9M1_9ALTE|nr:FAD:protein FMN transferase [Catenovulum agarivorans]EWH09529.1 ApbE family lipoprotein [Catenovulum agarivorans DS-2]
MNNFVQFFTISLCCIYCLLTSPLQAKWMAHNFNVMGTAAEIRFYQPALMSEQQAQRLLVKLVDVMHQIDESMSPYKSNSELSQVNQEAHAKPLKVSADLLSVINKAQYIAKLSGGIFDITFASAGHLYQYREHIRPTELQLAQASKFINYQDIALDEKNSTIHFLKQGTKIDLGGIAKGFAVQKCLTILEQAGVEHALVNAGGDTGLLGDKLGKNWMVAIKHPRQPDKQAALLPLANEAISTSGDYERYFIEDGQRYHHILNPRTGKSAKKLVSVSVIGPDAMMTDALSTTVFILGRSAGFKLLEQFSGYEAIVIDNELNMHFSTGLVAN